MTDHTQPSLYDDLPSMLAQKPFHFGHEQYELDALNLSLAGYKGMPKHSLADKARAKQEFMRILTEFDHATPKAIRMMDLIHLKQHEEGRSELEEMIGMNAAVQKTARYAAEDHQTARLDALNDRSERQFDTIRKEIRMRRETVQPVRPRIMKDDFVLRGLDAELYMPFAFAFSASVAEDRKRGEKKYELASLKHINALSSEVQAFVVMYQYAESIEKFRQKFIQKAKEAGDNPGHHWSKHREELWPYLQKITDKYNAKLREIDSVATATAGKEGYSTLPAYKEWLKAEEVMHNPKFFVTLQKPRDAMRHLAMEYFVGGEERATGERRHKLLTRIETAYQDDLADIAERRERAKQARIDTIEARQTPLEFREPFEACLHTLNRVYEGRWAALADEVLDQAQTKLLSDPGIYVGALTAKERHQADIAERRAAQQAQQEKDAAQAELVAAAAALDAIEGEVMSRRNFTTLRRRAAEPGTAVDTGDAELKGRTAKAPARGRTRGGSKTTDSRGDD